MRHRGERFHILVISARTQVYRHSATAFRMILRELDETPHLVARLHVWRDQALTSRIKQPRDILILQVWYAHDRRYPSRMRLRNHFDYRFEVVRRMLRANHHEVHSG